MSETKKPSDKITVYDKYGRELQVTREDWRTKILPGSIKDNWQNPDGLYSVILTALQDEFFQEVLPAARQLHALEPQSPRSACILAITLLKTRNVNEAELVLLEHNKKNGEDASVLTNLAKVYSEKNLEEKVAHTLWRALEKDPNQDNALMWFAAREREKSGDPGWASALQKVAALKASWRAQLWLARIAVDKKDIAGAMALYRQALARVSVAPADLIMQISGDLGNAGFISQLVELCGPLFNAKVHGLGAGNNLIQAYVALNDGVHARKILAALHAEQRPDWKPHLSKLEQQIDQIDKGYGKVSASEEPPRISMLQMFGPIWGRETSDFFSMVPTKEQKAPSITFIAGTVEDSSSKEMTVQATNISGRISRGLPLFLSEQVHLSTNAITSYLVPWVEKGGFAVFGQKWSFDAYSKHNPRTDCLVVFHLVASQSGWLAQLEMWEGSTGKSMGKIEVTLDPNSSGQAIREISESLLRNLQKLPGLKIGNAAIPPPANLVPYITGLEQTLALACASMSADVQKFISGDRDIFDGLLNLCLAEPTSARARMLLFIAFEKEFKWKPEIVREYRGKVSSLMKDHPLPAPLQGIMEKTSTRLFG